MQIDALKGENLRVAVYHRVPIRVINQVSSYELIAKERRDYVERNGWTFLGIYIDEGQPGKGRERLMADCAAGKADLVLVRSMSKLDRDLPEVLRIADELASLPQPVGIFFEAEDFYTLSSDRGDPILLLTALAEWEPEQKRRSHVVTMDRAEFERTKRQIRLSMEETGKAKKAFYAAPSLEQHRKKRSAQDAISTLWEMTAQVSGMIQELTE